MKGKTVTKEKAKERYFKILEHHLDKMLPEEGLESQMLMVMHKVSADMPGHILEAMKREGLE